MESREGKAERVYFKEKEKDMEILSWTHEDNRIDNPLRWLEVESKVIDEKMIEYNNVAFEQGEDVIMAFKMTAEEYAEATKEALDEATEDNSDK